MNYCTTCTIANLAGAIADFELLRIEDYFELRTKQTKRYSKANGGLL